MTYSPNDLDDAVGALLKEACARFVMPRYGQLRQDEVEEKSSPTDLVTVADREAELFLTPRLLDLIDGEVIGEEACAGDPDIRSRAARIYSIALIEALRFFDIPEHFRVCALD